MPFTPHMKKTIPGAICAAIGGTLILFGGIFYFSGYMAYQQMMQLYAEYGSYGFSYTPPDTGIMSFGTFLLVLGFIILAIGIGFLAKGVSIYRNDSKFRYRPGVKSVILEAGEPQDEEEDSAVSSPSTRPQSTNHCPLCGEILLDTMAKCPSCQYPVETRIAKPLPSTPTEEKVEKEVQYKNYCMYCGTPLSDTPGLTYCPSCGKKVAL